MQIFVGIKQIPPGKNPSQETVFHIFTWVNTIKSASVLHVCHGRVSSLRIFVHSELKALHDIGNV